MEVNFDGVDTTPLLAASVVVLRDVPAGSEFFLFKRHSDFPKLAVAHVFSSVKVYPADERIDARRSLVSSADTLAPWIPDPEISPVTATGLFRDTVSEVIEECGVLFSRKADSQQSAAVVGPTGAGTLVALLANQSRRPGACSLLPRSRGITRRIPSARSKRSDPRFFAAALSAEQPARLDHVQTVDGV